METLTKRLAGPSTAKAGMDSVDQSKVNEIIFKASEVPGNDKLSDVLTASGEQVLRERAQEGYRAHKEDRGYAETTQGY
jgi:hypothetical protein